MSNSIEQVRRRRSRLSAADICNELDYASVHIGVDYQPPYATQPPSTVSVHR